MKRYDLKPKCLRELFGLDEKVSNDAFERLEGFLEIKEFERKSTIRHAGSIESESRFLVEGMVGMYYLNKLTRLYFPGDVFMDFESYQTQVPSKFRFKALINSVFISLSYSNEGRVLEEIPEFTDFSKSQIAKVRHADFEWHAFTQMNYRDKIRIIEEKFPSFKYDLTNTEKAHLLGVSYATAARIKRGPERRNNGMLAGQLGKLLQYPFPSYVHPDALEIEEHTASWAYHFHPILRSKEEISYYKKNKFSYLSSCLYPEIELERGFWISKLYLWLFYLDDMSDDIFPDLREDFWGYLLVGVNSIIQGKHYQIIPTRINDFLNAFKDLYQEFKSLVLDNKELENLIFSELIKYLRENKIEANFKVKANPPSLTAYQNSRPIFSGGNLALALCAFESGQKFKMQNPDWQKTNDLRSLAARLIYLSNDLISYQKEASQGDFMNLVALLMHHKKMEFKVAQQEVLNVHAETLKKFMELDKKWKEEYRPENSGILQYLKQIKYKVAGSVHWSLSISTRYKKN